MAQYTRQSSQIIRFINLLTTADTEHFKEQSTIIIYTLYILTCKIIFTNQNNELDQNEFFFKVPADLQP